MTIRFILLQNRLGKTRLSKWYTTYSELEQERLKIDVHRVVTARDPRYTNFIEFQSYRIVYRRYAGLYFAFAIDLGDNEVAILEAIHLLVTVLDCFFESVCEMDLVYNFHKVYLILDEMFLAGEIQEVSVPTVLNRVRMLESQR